MTKEKATGDGHGLNNERDPAVVADAAQGEGTLEAREAVLAHGELKERLEQKEAEAAEYLDTLKRLQAEMENFRKRMIKEQEQIIQYASQTVILELLPVIDNLERALDAAEADSESGRLKEGVELIYTQLKGLLAKECVEVIDPMGEEFDPMKHEAVMQVASDDYAENIVVEVLQKGYDLKGRLLRPAMVKVAK